MPTRLRLCLASASPRRQELLRQLGVEFEVMAADIPEQPAAGEAAADFVRRVARDKAATVGERRARQRFPVLPVLGADTCIELDGAVLGKPRDRADGLTMLRQLAGRTHTVWSAFSLWHEGAFYGELNESRVTFAPMSEDDIERYWDSGEPVDKAGAYAIQGRGAAFISRIEGSYSGIVGLPLYELASTLKALGLADA